MVFFDWLASKAARRARPNQPFVSMYNDDSDDDNSDSNQAEARSPVTGSPKGRARPTSTQGNRTLGDHGGQLPANASGAVSLVPRHNGCLSPQEFMEHFKRRRKTDLNYDKIAQYKTLIQNDIAPKLDRSGGRDVSVAEMERLIAFFGEVVFWNQLQRTRFRWRENVPHLGATMNDGNLIEMDPHPGNESSDHMLSTLMHECCHAILRQHACPGSCWSRSCASDWDDQVGRKEGHGPVWIELARGADSMANYFGLFRCRTDWQNY